MGESGVLRPAETLGERLVAWLEAYGIDTVFGIPGVHTIEMYRGLSASRIRHMTPRHEQGAAFMADGHWRASGRVAAVFLITGPGLTNAITAMAQAAADSVPMLVVSAVNARDALGTGAGDLHEVHDQRGLSEHVTAFSQTMSDPRQLPGMLARAFAVFEGARPRPVHLEIPRDLFAVRLPAARIARAGRVSRPAPAPAALGKVLGYLERARTPLILAGGGVTGAQAALTGLAERLDAPVVMTTNARGLLAHGHRLAVPASPSLKAVRSGIAEADVVLALGTEIGRTDYDMYDSGAFSVPGRLIRIDVDAEQLHRGAIADLAIVSDAGEAACALATALTPDADGRDQESDGAWRAAGIRDAAWEEIGEDYRSQIAVLDMIRDALPEVPVVGDSTNPVYAGNLWFAPAGPRRWFNAATGYGALGYGLPAAIGAARATGGRAVCIAGDGGLQFSLTELGLAVAERLGLVLVVWNNSGYGEIGRFMDAAGVDRVGVDLHTPAFLQIAEAYGAAAARVDALDALPDLLAAAAARKGPTVIEIDERLVLG